MHPPFFVVDHRVGQDPLPLEGRRVIRRNRPERLDFCQPLPGQPAVTFAAVHPPAPLRALHETRAAAWLGSLLRRRVPDRVTR
jgi:hypothetical protein